MIQYALKCADGHTFDSWFQSAAAFDKLAAARLVSCAVCGNGDVKKAIMTPRVRPGRKAVSGRGEPEVSSRETATATDGAGAPTAVQQPQLDQTSQSGPMTGALSMPSTETEKAMAELRRKVEDNSDYVGKDFVAEARAMHEGDAPGRAIHGEARLDEAKELIEEGVPVLPLPFLPNRKTN